MRTFLLLLLLFSIVNSQQYNSLYPTTLPFNPNNPNRDINPVNAHYQPFYSSNASRPLVPTTGVNLQFRLRSYSNPNFNLAGGGYCNCPSGTECSASDDPTRCHVKFVFVVTTPGEPARMLETPYFDLDSTGKPESQYQQRWGGDHVVATIHKPTSLDIFVQHYGFSFKSDGVPSSVDKFHLVDHFTVSLQGELPHLGGVADTNENRDYLGELVRSHMQLYLSLSCSGSLIGPDCDMSCNASHINNRVAACQSHTTGYFAICNYNQYNQAENCKRCPWGIRDGTYCQDEIGGVLDPATAGVVDTSYRTATIALSIICAGLLLALLILTFLLFCKRRQTKYDEEELPGHNAHITREGPAARPLLQARYSAEQAPTPLPRSAPSLDITPTKSALRKPVLVPPAHLGGSNSVNDTLNSSFASDIPVRPSRSEIV